MTVRRMMGTETEYAVSDLGREHYNPVQLSFDVVSGAANPETQHIRWDYRQEDPLNDARGTRLPRAAARPDMLTDEPQRQIVNVIASNGGRIYVDHAHPEYSAPETMDPFEAVCYDHAGDALMREATRKANERNGSHIVLHRNNVDGKGASWGTHENYMMLRNVPFEKVAALMTLHFVSRQIYAGSGRVGIGEKSEEAGYQLSQRADYVHSIVGLQTTFDRPIVNARDESHVTGDFRRLHVIVGDANRMDVPQALKLGTTSMLLWLLEQTEDGNSAFDIEGLLADLQLVDPVEAMHIISHDLSLAAPLPLEQGGNTTAWQIQVRLLSAVSAQGAATYGTDSRGDPLWPDEPTKRVMAMWQQALADVAKVRHASDDERLTMTDEGSRLEWLLKWQLMERLRSKIGENWSSPKLAALDLSWAALDPSHSVFARLQSQTERTFVNLHHQADSEESDISDSDSEPSQVSTQQQADAELERATSTPPEDTRAWLRAEILRLFPQDVVAASWSHITVSEDSNDDANAHPDYTTDAEGNRMARRSAHLYSLDISDSARWTKSQCEQSLVYSEAHNESAVQALKRLAN
ncbi:depupylase/deamidase Dop [Bifidobacterium sp. ESL0682]|uniref:depupylase/deamidase Dop n=1 Tax=Bifidobacterium sp. ESL0682 TaxID=2983212 RepID=UPI0023F96102|nr:depupylase/deamidase Dop [Bifidobacterium sp. ESL0682]WEV41447.1 depupylase/deamidase Dop [Bifidobacterium sp. ESL0682]